jgi:ABC-type phosphate transport system substrate-binding protein
MRTHLFFVGALGALIAAPRIAGAQVVVPPCPTFVDPIVVAGSTAVQPLINAMQPILAQQAAPTTLVYAGIGSCNGVNAVASDTAPADACKTGTCITGSVSYFDTTATPAPGKLVTCTLAAPVHVDVGLSDVSAQTCLQAATGAAGGMKDVSGPVEPMLFVVPKNSFLAGNIAITAEEAYFVFGFGASGNAQPWTVEADLARRNAQSGTQQVIAYNINVPAGVWKGSDKGGSGKVVEALVAANSGTSPGTAIGILGSDIYDSNRTTLSALAFQTFHQKGAFYADSTATSFDKRNVRDGHYVNWGYLHMLTRLDAGSAQNAAAKRFVDWVNGNTASTPVPASPTWDITALTIQAKLVPTCAMKVARSNEGSALTPFAPTVDCSAMFETMVPH